MPLASQHSGGVLHATRARGQRRRHHGVHIVVSGADTALIHVLVADDEPHIGRIIKMKLEQGPFQVTLAHDGQEALAVLKSDPSIGVVVLDLMMPNLSGLDVLTAMRGSEQWQSVPCIILTAAGQAEQQIRAMQLGATDFMTKPFSPKRLYARIAALAGVADEAIDGQP